MKWINKIRMRWASTASLAYPIAAAGYMAVLTPANPLSTLGYGLANMGYLLLAAGTLKGTFRGVRPQEEMACVDCRCCHFGDRHIPM